MSGTSRLERLSTEVVDSILDNIDGSKASLAATSSEWRRTVEGKTFANITFDSTHDSLGQFDEAFSDTSRIPLVKNLKYRVILPSYSITRRTKFPSKNELALNNVALTQALVDFFNRVKGWGELGSEDVQFALDISCASDDFSGAWDLDKRNMFTYLTLVDGSIPEGGFPPIPAISGFSISLGGDRRIHPDALGAILSSLPRLKKASWEFYAPERRHPERRRELRLAFGHLLQRTPFPCLEKLTVFCEDPDPANEKFEPGDVLASNGEDTVSLGIRRICSLPRLRSLRLSGKYILSPVAFSTPNTDTYSPSLSHVMIDASAVTPDGHWYFTGDPDEPSYESDDDSEEDEGDPDVEFDSDISDEADRPPENAWERANGNRPQFTFRTTPYPERFDPLITSLARAVKRMPALGTLEVSWNDPVGISFTFFAPGRRPRRDLSPEMKVFHDSYGEKLRCVMDLTSSFETEWDISEELRNAVREACDPECLFILR